MDHLGNLDIMDDPSYLQEQLAAKSSICERFPGRGISLAAWRGAISGLDRVHVMTSRDVPSLTSEEDEEGVSDPTMHPQHQTSFDSVLDIYTYPGSLTVAKCMLFVHSDNTVQATQPHGMVV